MIFMFYVILNLTVLLFFLKLKKRLHILEFLYTG